MIHKCDFKDCDYSSNNSYNLNRHKAKHSDERPYKCDVKDCNSAFKTSDDLTQHGRVHDDKKPFKCDVKDCNSTFKRQSHLNRHQLTHSNEKPYKCDFKDCNSMFKSHDNLVNHKTIHIDKRLYICDFKDCNSTFKTSRDLNTHKHRHDDNKPYECNYQDCNLAFKTPYELNNHQKIHTREKPFKCDYIGCNSEFATAGNLNRHKLIHTGEYKYYCKECGYLFREKGNLNRHIKSLHSGVIKPFERKEEKLVYDLLKKNNIVFDYIKSIDFCKIIENKERAFLDFIIQFYYGIIFLEVDENGGHHAHNLITDAEVKSESESNFYNVTCEQARMMNVLASSRAEGITLPIAFLRYNPNSFKRDKMRLTISQEERDKVLINFIQNWRPKQDFEIHYYCYDQYTLKDENTTKRVSVWDHKDFDPKLQECVFIV
jgi:hypothetical protein